MKQATLLIAALLLFATALGAHAAPKRGAFRKSVQHGGTAFEVASRPIQNNSIHILSVTARRNGKTFAQFKCDSDYEPERAWAADLAGDGTSVLVIAGARSGGGRYGFLELYVPEQDRLRRVVMPPPEDPAGYKGQDSFELDGRQIVRTFPLYRPDDAAGRPTGGSRTLKYEFRQGRLELYVQSDNPAEVNAPAKLAAPAGSPTAAVSPKPAAPAAAGPAPAEKPAAAPAPPAPAGGDDRNGRLTVTGVTATERGIAIATSGPVPKHRLLLLDKPRRYAVDIPGAASPLSGRRVPLGALGISRARIGQNKGFLRVVLDTEPAARVAKPRVGTTDTGLIVEFGGE